MNFNSDEITTSFEFECLENLFRNELYLIVGFIEHCAFSITRALRIFNY